ncbi:MAG: polyprenyl diphosphate synthase [Eubacteriales bacterium]|uniref:polyprenyl diphosphate synthase n=1 Tax=Fenollaria sp. TaxID=1965292 RepID=UPI002A74D655|nr:polyprenyl diphosphate synthase [Fenollaria sp.]MDD7339215.1 polyprenyl diphosphate synthase [Eubacteriales bacterium]MDY3106211.1 polyprenyl diphosphate synthase [Fenollaria sp.]
MILNHVAIIMDGNGRWAKKRNMPRTYGHKEGMNRVIENVRYASDTGIKYLTLYAFSKENWKRPKEEVSFLMKLIIIYINSQIDELDKNNVKIVVSGDLDGIYSDSKAVIDGAIERTSKNTGLVLNICLNYGSRDEIIRAINLAKKDNKEINSYEDLKEYFYNPSIPDPDLIIRTSGEERLSNFLLMQSAYSELYFTQKLWPDFHKEDFREALENFALRHRRYGGI